MTAAINEVAIILTAANPEEAIVAIITADPAIARSVMYMANQDAGPPDIRVTSKRVPASNSAITSKTKAWMLIIPLF
jgi:hypothetical protein